MPPNEPMEIKLIWAWENNPKREENHTNGEYEEVMNCITVDSYTINEYNT
jgi:hypothetical protein